jgi:hypothetical protein
MSNVNASFTSDEEKRIQAEMEEYNRKAREAEIESEIRNRILDAQRQEPGKRYN